MSQKIVFMGTPEFSVPTLESLVNSNHKVLAVYSQPASKANRGQKLTPSRGTLDISKAKKLLDFNPSYPLETGYRKYIKWYKTFGK